MCLYFLSVFFWLFPEDILLKYLLNSKIEHSSFPHLQSLSLQMSSLDKRFLHHLMVLYGDQLQELKIEIKQEDSHQDVVMDLFDVFNLCPRLVTFHLLGSVACVDFNTFCSHAHFQ